MNIFLTVIILYANIKNQDLIFLWGGWEAGDFWVYVGHIYYYVFYFTEVSG